MAEAETTTAAVSVLTRRIPAVLLFPELWLTKRSHLPEILIPHGPSAAQWAGTDG